MDLIHEISETLRNNDEKTWEIIERDFGFKVIVGNWVFDIPDTDEVTFYKNNIDVTKNVLDNHFWKWNGFYKYIKHIHHNSQIFNKLLEDLETNSRITS